MGQKNTFGYTSAKSEQIWIGWNLEDWGKCWGLALADFGRDPRSSYSLSGSHKIFCEVNNAWFHRLSNCRYCADCAQNLPRPAPNNVLKVLLISSKSAHVRRSCRRTLEHRFCPVEYLHNSPEAMLRFGRIIMCHRRVGTHCGRCSGWTLATP